MNVKKDIDDEEVERIKGGLSMELTENCPDMRHTFPSVPCSNLGCDYSIKEPRYMNCTFVASEAGSHTLEAIGEMMNITREGVRLIERRALMKIRAHIRGDEADGPQGRKASVHKQNLDAGEDLVTPDDSSH